MKVSDRPLSGDVYAFGPFVLDAARRRLTKGAHPVALTPKAFDALLALVARAGRTIEKDELLALVWPDTAVEENNLTQAISRARKALGDDGDNHTFILTQPGKGYRFVADVRTVALRGQTLAARLPSAPLAPAEAVRIALGILDALQDFHRDGRAHGALTPAGIDLTSGTPALSDPATPGTIDDLSSWRYRAPEQVNGQQPQPASDVFAVGAILYEMLVGTPPFPGESADEIKRAVLTRTPPTLGGSPAVAMIDRIVQRALARAAADRYPSARAMADELRSTRVAMPAAGDTPAHTRPRVIVLPFRVLRPDAETDFLAFSLPDAITTSLSGLDSLVVRSSLAAARLATETIDLGEVGARADADLVLTGTLLRDGDEVRVNTQLAATAGGEVVWSQLSQAPLGGVFRLQDELTNRIVSALPRSLSARDARLLGRDKPVSSSAYEYYLRANQLSFDPRHWAVARDLYLQCVEEDPQYAPAWARLGRIYRVLGAYGSAPTDVQYYHLASEAFQRALALNPDLPLAHNLYTMLEVEMGHADSALRRLLERAAQSAGDAELFAGLVHACRYCGLLDAAVAAYRIAHRLDPDIRTSVSHAYWALGEYEKAIETDLERPPFATVFSLIGLGRHAEALARLTYMEALELPRSMHHFIVATRALLEERHADAAEACDRMLDSGFRTDPCGCYYRGRLLAAVGDTERALSHVSSAVNGGFYCVSALARDPWLDSLHGSPAFAEIIREAERRQRAAAATFMDAGGNRLLGLPLG